MATPRKRLSAYPDAQKAYDKLLIEGPYEVELKSKNAALAFRHRCHMFRKKYTDLCDENPEMENIYAMCMIQLVEENECALRFVKREDPIELDYGSDQDLELDKAFLQSLIDEEVDENDIF